MAAGQHRTVADPLVLRSSGTDGHFTPLRGHRASLLSCPTKDSLGVVQIRVTSKTRNPFTFKVLSISGVTWNWHVLNHANAQAHSQLGDMGTDPLGRHPICGLDHVVEIPVPRQELEPTAVTVQHRLSGPRTL